MTDRLSDEERTALREWVNDDAHATDDLHETVGRLLDECDELRRFNDTLNDEHGDAVTAIATAEAEARDLRARLARVREAAGRLRNPDIDDSANPWDAIKLTLAALDTPGEGDYKP